MNKKITLIAEIGENHLGKMNFAKRLISNAKAAGADFAKFQSYNEKCLKKNDPEYKWFKKENIDFIVDITNLDSRIVSDCIYDIYESIN